MNNYSYNHKNNMNYKLLNYSKYFNNLSFDFNNFNNL